jgi:hypothetical protein
LQSPLRAITLISTACSWVNVIDGQEAVIVARVGQSHFGGWVSFPSAETACLRSNASLVVTRLLPPVLLPRPVCKALRPLAANTHRFCPGRSRPRQPNHVKPHAR